MQTNFNAAAAIASGQLDLVVSAGVEMMSRVPMGSNGGSISGEVTSRHEIVMQGTSAELLAKEWRIGRDAQDAYSLESHRRAVAAIDEGRFESEIAPIDLPDEPSGGGAATRTRFAVDEAARRDTSLEKLAALAPAFQADGTVTAGNSSQIVDGAAAVLIASEDALATHALEPRARFVSFGLAGVDPTRMLHGNPEAITSARVCSITEMARLEGVPPNMSVSRITPWPSSTSRAALRMSERRRSMSSSGPMQTAFTPRCGPTTCSMASTNSSANRPWVTITSPIIKVLPPGPPRNGFRPQPR
jgi:acetyl-CoA acetyltransferase